MAGEMARSELSDGSVIPGDVMLIRGRRVMLDRRVAAAFGTTTKRVNEAVARNRRKFNDSHVFQLTKAEFEVLRSRTATSKPGSGGARYAPHVFTVKGVARLATILDTPSALEATDLIIDTFIAVQSQLSSGRKTVAIDVPERYRTTDEQREESNKLWKRLRAAISKLLDTVVDPDGNQTLGEASKSLGAKVLANASERLRTKGLENAKLEADTALVLAQAEKVWADARNAHADADDKIFKRRLGAVRQISELIAATEPPELVELIEDFGDEPLRLEAPDIDDVADEGAADGTSQMKD